jgi:GGDEF domain-containing protein
VYCGWRSSAATRWVPVKSGQSLRGPPARALAEGSQEGDRHQDSSCKPRPSLGRAGEGATLRVSGDNWDSGQGDSASALMAAADAQLYAAKSAGRNQAKSAV